MWPDLKSSPFCLGCIFIVVMFILAYLDDLLVFVVIFISSCYQKGYATNLENTISPCWVDDKKTNWHDLYNMRNVRIRSSLNRYRHNVQQQHAWNLYGNAREEFHFWSMWMNRRIEEKQSTFVLRPFNIKCTLK